MSTIYSNELREGSMLVLHLMGVYSNASTSDDWAIRMKLGGTTYETIARTGGNATSRGWKASFTLTFRAVGSSGEVYDHATLVDGSNTYSADIGSSHTVDMTVAEDIEATLQWDNAKTDNVFQCTQAYLERIG